MPPPPRGMFDTHLHVGDAAEADSWLAAARDAGVDRFVLAAGDLGDSRRNADIARGRPGVQATVGVHPHEAAGFDGDLEPFRQLLLRPEVAAVGEIGLDYHYDHSPRPVQRRVFRAFLALAAEAGLPAVIHCRDAYEDCLDVLRTDLVPGQPIEIHSYTGTTDWARTVLQMGAFMSFNGIVTFRKADNVRQALNVVPADKLLLETDSPYLAPVPHRGRRNQPAYLPAIVGRVAEIRGWTPEETAGLTRTNGEAFFGGLPGRCDAAGPDPG